MELTDPVYPHEEGQFHGRAFGVPVVLDIAAKIMPHLIADSPVAQYAATEALDYAEALIAEFNRRNY